MKHGYRVLLMAVVCGLAGGAALAGTASFPIGTTSQGIAEALENNNWGGGLLCSTDQVSSATGQNSILSIYHPSASNRVAIDFEALAGTTVAGHTFTLEVTAAPVPGSTRYTYTCTFQADNQPAFTVAEEESYLVGDNLEVRLTPKTHEVRAVPTLGTWALIVMGLGVFGIGVAMIWRIV